MHENHFFLMYRKMYRYRGNGTKKKSTDISCLTKRKWKNIIEKKTATGDGNRNNNRNNQIVKEKKEMFGWQQRIGSITRVAHPHSLWRFYFLQRNSLFCMLK